MKNRRKFIVALFSVVAPLQVLGQKTRKRKSLIVHHTLFWLKNPKSMEDKGKLIKNLTTLEKIESHRTLIGVPVYDIEYAGTDSTYDVSIITYFDNVEGRIRYENNPVHRAFIEECNDLWQRRISYDTVCEIR